MIDNPQKWFLLAFVTLWLLAALTLPIIAFCLTDNPHSLPFFGTLAPPVVILHRITKTLIPARRQRNEDRLDEAAQKERIF